MTTNDSQIIIYEKFVVIYGYSCSWISQAAELSDAVGKEGIGLQHHLRELYRLGTERHRTDTLIYRYRHTLRLVLIYTKYN